MEQKLPTIKIEVKDASQLVDGLKDINDKPLPKEGIVIKKVKHCSIPEVEYIVPEGGMYYNYLIEKIRY